MLGDLAPRGGRGVRVGGVRDSLNMRGVGWSCDILWENCMIDHERNGLKGERKREKCCKGSTNNSSCEYTRTNNMNTGNIHLIFTMCSILHAGVNIHEYTRPISRDRVNIHEYTRPNMV